METKTMLTAIRSRLSAIAMTTMLCICSYALSAQTIRYVKPAASGTGDGSSWANASADLNTMISSSAAGDSVFVAAGTYQPIPQGSFYLKQGVKVYGGFAGTETYSFQRNWTINVTTFQGNGSSIIFNGSALTAATLLDGFTLNGGYSLSYNGGAMYNWSGSMTIANCIFSNNFSYNGGAVFNNNASPVFINCTFSNNSANTLAGAIYNRNSSPTFTNCTFSSNNCPYGGAIVNEGSSPLFTGCTFSGNTALDTHHPETGIGGAVVNRNNPSNGLGSSPSFLSCHFLNNTGELLGGAVYSIDASAPSYVDCIFQGNTSEYGAGIYDRASSPATITNCGFFQNTADYDGAGLYIMSSNPVLTGCSFRGNHALAGGGVYNESGAPAFRNCLFSGNYGHGLGGGLMNVFASAFIDNCTFSGNRTYSVSSQDGAGIYNAGTSTVFINNSIIWGNSTNLSNNSATPTVQYSVVEGGYPGTGNQNFAPQFKDAPSFSSAPFTNGDYRLSPCSQLINLGNSALIPANLLNDIVGNPRVLGAGVDMGAYEYGTLPATGNIIYVNQALTDGRNNGNDWSNAMFSLADALRFAKVNEASWTPANPLKIFVAKGTYKPAYLPNMGCGGDRYNTFLMVNNVQIYGGFDPANGIAGLSDSRIFGTGGSILSGNIGALNSASDNCYHVVVSSGAVGTALMNGFTVQDGFANGAGSNPANGNVIYANNGAGIYQYASSPAYANLIVSGNPASNWGGGIYADVSNYTCVNCTVTGNAAGNHGGGIFNSASTPAISNSSFSGNTSPFGGAIYNHNSSSPTIQNTSFSNNTATMFGGAVYNSGASPDYINCTFTSNSTSNSTGGGGAMFNNEATTTVTNCTFTTNSGDYGGAIREYSTSISNITGCNFNTNTAGLFGGAMYIEPAATTTIDKCIFTGNNTQFGGAVLNGGLSSFRNSSFAGNIAASYGGAIYNTATLSAAIFNCVFSNNRTVNGGGGGGAVFNNNSYSWIANCTYYGNTADFGGAIHNYSNSIGIVRNSIIWGNNSGIYNESGASADVQYTVIQGGYAGTGNLNSNPMFVNTATPAGADGTWLTADDGLTVLPCSPAVNAGDNTVLTGYPIDTRGYPRFQYVTIDMGAYEANSLANANTSNISSGNVAITAWQPANGKTYYATNCTTLVAAITSSGTGTSISGNTTVKSWIESTQPAQFVKRHYEISPLQVDPNTATGSITLYFTQPEFDAFNAVNVVKLPQNPGDVAGKANLLIEKRGGTSNNGTGLPPTYTGPAVNINPVDADIVWNATASRWEISFNVTGFSGFFIKTTGSTLPLRLISFSAKENNCISTVEWTTTNEINVSHFEVEQSTDGITFSSVKTIAAKNTGIENKYSIISQVMSNKVFYRLKMVDIDGKVSYSNVAIVMADCASKLFIYPNPTRDKLFLTNATVGSIYEIYDNAGRKVMGGWVKNNVQEIRLNGMSSGLYSISVKEKNGDYRNLRFMKD